MFESIKQNDTLDSMKYASSMLISLLVHSALISVLVLVPLIFCNVLHPGESIAFLLLDPALPQQHEPEIPPVQVSAAERPKGIEACRDCAPPRIPEGIPTFEPPVVDLDSMLPVTAAPQLVGLPMPVPTGQKGLDIYLAGLKPAALPVLKPVKAKNPPVVVISSLQEAKLIVKTPPVYPRLAVATRTSGVVVLEAMIDEEGNVAELKVVSGHKLLVDAARDAVKQWKYSPTILNGEVVPVRTTINVTFRIQ